MSITFMRKFLRRIYLQLITYYWALFGSSKVPANKFIVFFLPRAGSNLLVDLINSHPQIRCDYEIFSAHFVNKKPWFPKLYLKGRWAKAKKDFYGYKLNSCQIGFQGFEAKAFFADLHQQGWKIICIRRKNLLRQAISFFIAQRRKEWVGSRNNTLTEEIPIDKEELLAKIERLEKVNQAEEELLGQLPYLNVFYEDDLLNAEQHQATLDKVFAFLGVESAPVKTDIVKTAASHKLADVIANYAEIESFIGKTKYAHFLYEE